jgi:hypothetical protein
VFVVLPGCGFDGQADLCLLEDVDLTPKLTLCFCDLAAIFTFKIMSVSDSVLAPEIDSCICGGSYVVDLS